jgi:hypothetical protein
VVAGICSPLVYLYHLLSAGQQTFQNKIVSAEIFFWVWSLIVVVSVKRSRDAKVSRERETHAAFVTLVTNAISVCQASHTAPNSAGNCYTENSVKCSRNFLCDKSNSVCDVARVMGKRVASAHAGSKRSSL